LRIGKRKMNRGRCGFVDERMVGTRKAKAEPNQTGIGVEVGDMYTFSST